MIEGLRCPPACHAYVRHGKVLVCTQCADVQPLLLAEEAALDARPLQAPPLPSRYADIPDYKASVAEIEAELARLRAAGAQLDLPLGQRAPFTGDLDEGADLVMRTNQHEVGRAKVAEGFETSPYDDALPDAGV